MKGTSVYITECLTNSGMVVYGTVASRGLRKMPQNRETVLAVWVLLL